MPPPCSEVELPLICTVRYNQYTSIVIKHPATVALFAEAGPTEARITADGAVYDRQLPIDARDASPVAATVVTANRATGYCHRRAVTADATSGSRRVAADNAVCHGQRSGIAEEAPATPKPEREAVLYDPTVAYCKAVVIKNTASSTAVTTKAVGDGQTGDGHVRRKIFKHPESVVAVNCQTFGTRAVNCYAVSDLKFATGQQDGARDAGGVDRVSVIRNGKRTAQRARATVIGVCDYDNVSWQRIAESH